MFETIAYIFLLLILIIMFKNMMSFRSESERGMNRLDDLNMKLFREMNEWKCLTNGEYEAFPAHEIERMLKEHNLNPNMKIAVLNKEFEFRLNSPGGKTLAPEKAESDVPALAPGRESQKFAPKSSTPPSSCFRSSITEILHEEYDN